MSGSQQFHYQLFGLRISSEIELPELATSEDDRLVDVRVRRAKLDTHGRPAAELVVEGHSGEFHISGVASYRISQGCEILVDAVREASPGNVRLFLLGSAMGLLLHQRGMLALHANAVEIGGRAYAFMGPSGSGKSTLAAAFHDRGCSVIADDVCAVGMDPKGQAVAYSGIPRLRLWEDALFATGRRPDDHDPSFCGDDDYHKFDVMLPSAAAGAIPLAAIILLAVGDELELAPIEGAEAIDAIFANTYRGAFIAEAGDPKNHWRACVDLVRSVPLFRLRRPFRHSSNRQIIDLFSEEGRLSAGGTKITRR